MKKRKGRIQHYLIFSLISGLIIYLGGLIYADNIVLGNATTSTFAAVVLTALVITLVISVMPQVFAIFNLKKLTIVQKYLVYALVNTVVIWLLSRLALQFGLGLSSKFTAVTIGAVLTIAQYIYWEYFVS